MWSKWVEPIRRVLHQWEGSWCQKEQQYMSLLEHKGLEKLIFYCSGFNAHNIRAGWRSMWVLDMQQQYNKAFKMFQGDKLPLCFVLYEMYHHLGANWQ